MKENKRGITLIALIITIIVMLILVGVTVTTAINGGLFSSARNAAKKTTYEKEKEELTAATVYAYNEATGKIDKTKLQNELKNWNIEESTTSLFKCTSPNNNVFTIDENGEVSLQEPLKISYRLNEGKKGQYMLTLIENENLCKKILKPYYEENKCNDIKELMKKILEGSEDKTITEDELLKTANIFFVMKDSDISENEDTGLNEGKILLDNWDDIEKAWAFEIALLKEEVNVINNNAKAAFEWRNGVGFSVIRFNARKE